MPIYSSIINKPQSLNFNFLLSSEAYKNGLSPPNYLSISSPISCLHMSLSNNMHLGHKCILMAVFYKSHCLGAVLLYLLRVFCRRKYSSPFLSSFLFLFLPSPSFSPSLPNSYVYFQILTCLVFQSPDICVLIFTSTLGALYEETQAQKSQLKVTSLHTTCTLDLI